MICNIAREAKRVKEEVDIAADYCYILRSN
jgi:hypothetical protein